jgi:hypothetical protein
LYNAASISLLKLDGLWNAKSGEGSQRK